MIGDITIGQYLPGDSIIHKLDPRVKIILLIACIVVLFVANNLISFVFLIAVTLFYVWLTGIPFKLYIRGLKPLFIIICFTAVINLFTGSGEPLVSFWIFKITSAGISNAVSMVVRIMLLVITTTMLTYTTSPVVLTSGFERLLSPLAKIKLPVHEFSMMITIALRFIPTLLEETEKIINAQKARGADFESGGLIKRAKSLIPILIPLFVSAFRRADELAVAMECRCYTGGENRTHFVKYNICRRDILACVFVSLVLVSVILINTFVPALF